MTQWQVQDLFIKTLNSATDAALDKIAPSWTAHVPPLKWASESRMRASGIIQPAGQPATTKTRAHRNWTSPAPKARPPRGGTDRRAMGVYLTALHRACLEGPARCKAYLRWLTAGNLETLGQSAPLDDVFTDHTWNVFIAGGGPVGLYLANALAMVFSPREARIVVVEKRVFLNGTKRPYARKWPTDLNLELFEESIDPRLVDIFRMLSVRCMNGPCNIFMTGHGGEKNHDYALRTEMNMMETALLLSCRSLGVRVLYDTVPDGNCRSRSFRSTGVGKLVCAANVRIDATGNRLRPFNKRKFVQEHRWNSAFLLAHSFQMPWHYQIPSTDAFIPTLPMVSHHDFLFPITPDGEIYSIHYAKLLHLPLAFKEVLENIEANCKWKTCGHMYLWTGPEDLSMFFNLRKSEANLFESIITDRVNGAPLNGQFMTSFLASAHIGVQVDSHLKNVLKLVYEVCQQHTIVGCESVRLAGPYEMNPFFVHRNISQSEDYVPYDPDDWIRIGDSLFQGDFTLGTGLGYHFAIIRECVAHVKKNLGAHVNLCVW
jgi:hypothetical protein